MMGERFARAALTALTEPGDPALWRFVERYGAVETVQAIKAECYPGRDGPVFRAKLEAIDPAALLRRAEACGGRLVCPGDPEWPEDAAGRLEAAAAGDTNVLDNRDGPPLALWTRGGLDLVEVMMRSCAVVGSRAASDYGCHVAGEFAADLAERDITVVSGAAFGIDAAAHRGALAVAGRTVAVVAGGIDRPYPRGHEALLERIATEGLVVSEVPPGSTPTRPRFLVRNRLIAAMTCGTVVVEAALRSGALNTAAWARACQREVMGVPGLITSDRSAGVHQLLRKGGALVVTDSSEIAEHIGRIGQDIAAEPRGEARPRDGLDPRARAVLEVVPVRSGSGVARIAKDAGMPPDETLAVLGQLHMAGFVERCDADWRLSRSERVALRRHASSVVGVEDG